MNRPPPGTTPPNTPPDAPTTIAFSVTDGPTERLDRFLADQCRWSRSRASRLIAGGAVAVNREPARAARRLDRGDEVAIALPAEPGRPPLAPRDIPLDVIYEDDWLLVVNKPAGLVVHPAAGHRDDTLVNALLGRGMRLGGGTAERPGIVHRLDRDTSGLLVVARTEQVHRRLAAAIARRRVRRRYAALVWGHLDGPRTIDAPIARHPTDRKRMAVVATGRRAVTHVEPLARYDVCDLVRVTLETGRTHQIRVHLAHVGHPVVGDPVYGGGGARRMTGAQRPAAEALERAVPRQALHAARLGLDHPETAEPLDFMAEWPDDLADALAIASGDPDMLARPQRLRYLGFLKEDG